MSKTFDELREGFKTDANRKAAFAKMNDKKTSEALSPAQKAAREKNRIGPKGEVGKREYGSDKAKRGFHKAQRGVSGKGDNRNTMSIFDRQPKTALQGNKPKGKLPEDSDAVKAFLAKGGKIKKLPPAKAQGYHGKDDPGKGMHGMMDKPDTKAMGTRKKVKSMESLWDNIRKRRAAGKPKLKPGDKNYPKTLKINDEVKEAIKYTHAAVDKKGKVVGMASKASDAKDMARRHGGTLHQLKKPMHPKVGDMMINRPFNPVLKKEAMSTSSGPFGINPTGIGVKVMKKGKEVKPTPPKIGVVSYTGGKKDKPNEGYKSYAQQKAVWASRADAKKKGKK